MSVDEVADTALAAEESIKVLGRNSTTTADSC